MLPAEIAANKPPAPCPIRLENTQAQGTITKR